MYDLPFDPDEYKTLALQIIFPKDLSAYIIDDLHFVHTRMSKIELTLEESSQVTYRLFVANHQLCETCPKKEAESCQTIPPVFEKEIDIMLNEPHAQAYAKCHYLGDGESKFHITTRQHHGASNTVSKTMVKGVLSDNAQLKSDNEIVVCKNLKKIKAEQMNKNLLLDTRAHVISIPKLIVHSRNVSCKHGAAVCSLDLEALFYLQNRGISLKQAQQILIEAFLGWILYKGLPHLNSF